MNSTTFVANCPEYWSLYQSFFYSITVVTTIGYGKHVPKTAPGRIATVVYAIIGIGIFGLVLSLLTDEFQINVLQHKFFKQRVNSPTKDTLLYARLE